jgi:hypothetical protein
LASSSRNAKSRPPMRTASPLMNTWCASYSMEAERGRESGDAASDHQHVGREPLGHERFRWSGRGCAPEGRRPRHSNEFAGRRLNFPDLRGRTSRVNWQISGNRAGDATIAEAGRTPAAIGIRPGIPAE